MSTCARAATKVTILFVLAALSLWLAACAGPAIPAAAVPGAQGPQGA